MALALLGAGAAPLTAQEKVITLDAVEMRLATLPQGTAGMMAEYVPEGNGVVYLLGGYRTGDGSGALELSRDVWVYDPALDELSSLGSLPIGLALAGHAYVPEENMIYLFGGLEQDGGSIVESNAVRAYDIDTGELTDLHATLSPARSRAAAVYVPDLKKIFLFGGTTGDGSASVSPYESSTQDQIEVFDVATGSLQTVGSAPGWYLDAHFVPTSYPALNTPEDPEDTTILADSFIYLAGPDGYALFDPAKRVFVTTGDSLDTNGLLGAATTYVPRRQRVWSAGGYGARTFLNQCWQGTVVAFDPTSLDGSGYLSSIPPQDANAPVLKYTQTDGSAVFVPSLDRALLFGGFLAPDGADCASSGAPEQLWPSLPGPATYRTMIYSVTPGYTFAPGAPASPLIPTKITGSPIKGETVTVTVKRDDPPFKANPDGQSGTGTVLADDESFVLALQAAYETPGQPPVLDMRFLARIDGMSPSDTKDVEITIPEDISSGSGQRSQQVVAVCTLSLDRPTLPPNCREVAVTLDPGSIAGTITRDLGSLEPPGGIEPVEGALVVLLDQSYDEVARTTTDAAGRYDLCPDGRCLAIVPYTLNVSKSYSSVGPESGFVHLPTASAPKVVGGTTTTADLTMKVSKAKGPLITSLRSDHNALTGDTIGTFLSFEHLRGKPFMPAIPSVANLLTVRTEDAVNQTSRVEFNLNGETYPASGGQGIWSVYLDMSVVLHAGDNILTVTAYDSSPPTPLFTTREFTIKAVAAKPTNGELKSYVDLQSIEWNPSRKRYRTRVVLPKDLDWPENPPDVLDLILIKLYSEAHAGIELVEDYHLDGHWTAQSGGGILLKILSADPAPCSTTGDPGCQLDERFPVTPTYTFDLSNVESYKIESKTFDLCELGLPSCGEWVELYTYPCDPNAPGITPQRKLQCQAQQQSAMRGFSASAAGFSVGFTLKLKLTLSAQYSATLFLDGTMNGDNWQLEQLRVVPTPHLGLQAKGEGTARAHVKAPALVPDFSVSITAWVILEGHLFYQQPIIYDPDRSLPLYLDDPCFNFLARAQAGIDLPSPIPNLNTGWWNIVEQDAPSGCYDSRGGKDHLPDPEPPPLLPNPVTAFSPFKDKTMFVWVEETEPSPGMTESHLFFKANGPLGETSGTVPTGGRVIDPALAFVNNDEALAVWSEIGPVTEADSLAEILSTQEAYAAIWNVNTGWGDRVQLSDNAVADGRPVITTAPLVGINGEAVVAWVRDPDATPETLGDVQIVARHWDGSTWGAEQLVADEPGTADVDPVLAYTKNGTGRAWMVWVRDHDADFATNEDRFLNYSIWNGTSWSESTEPVDWPAGALSPDLVFSPDSGLSEKPLVTMVVREDRAAAPDGTDVGSVGIGFESRLYAAWWGIEDDGWDVDPVAKTRAERPAAMLASDDRALIVMRSFGGGSPDDPPRLGAVAVAAGELNRDGARWVEPGTITTNDDEVFWLVRGVSIPLESAGDADFPFRMVGVRENLDGRQNGAKALKLSRGAPAQVAVAKGFTAKILGGDNLTGVFEFDCPTNGVDIELEKLTVNNLQPNPGDVVKVFAQIRNTTVRPMSEALGTGPPEACLYIDGQPVPDFENHICDERYYGELLFNERHTFKMEYRSTGRPELVSVKVTNGGDLNHGNQDAEILVGSVPVPQGLTLAAVQPGSSGGNVRVEASWQPPTMEPGKTWSYRVYRGPGAVGPWELLAFTTGRSYTDPSPDEDELYYAVEAFDELSRFSKKTVGRLLSLAEDADDDGASDAADVCPGFNDAFDADNDGVPDGCDTCAGFNDTVDSDGDGVANGCDVCENANDSIDTDGDGVPDGCEDGGSSPSGCQPGPTTACTLGDRFELEIDWRDFSDQTGPARVVPGGSEDSELFYFFSENNWEMLVKTLDGCAINNHFWVFAAATTNVEYTLRVTDTETGATSDYTNPLGVAADAITDTQAFECGDEGKALNFTATDDRQPAVISPVTITAAESDCTDTDTELCLNGGRYEVEVEWRDFGDKTGSAKVAPLRSADSGLLWFFSDNNWEMLVKVLDGCGINDNVWVFSAATTNVEYTLRVTDTETGTMREYFNPLGQAASAITDTGAFSCSQ